MAIQTFPSLLHWPRALMRDRVWQWELTGRTITGGRTLSGAIPMARFDGGGLWSCEMTDVQVSTADQVRAWRALSALLDGGATPVVLEARDERFAPWSGSATSPTSSLNSDGSGPSDGTTYQTPAITATLGSPADLRATSLQLIMSIAGSLRGGEMFSIEHQTYSHRLYRIAAVVQNGNVASVSIRPPLREATWIGAKIEFDNPKCVMQLATPDAMDLPLTRRTYGQARVRFVERMPPFGVADVVAPLPDPRLQGAAEIALAGGRGLSLDFTDSTFAVSEGFYGSAYIRDV